jgi:hypothetical protein
MLLAESLTFSNLSSIFVGLPDKFDIRPLDRLPIPSQIQWFPPRTKVLGADQTPDLARLMLLFLLLFQLIFTASKA